VRGKSVPVDDASARRLLCAAAWAQIRRDTCSPISNGIGFGKAQTKILPLLDSHQATWGGSYPGTVKPFRVALVEPVAYPKSVTSDDALWVRQAIGKLDPSEREILMLREYEELSYPEIAELLRLPVNTVRSRLFRSRMALKSSLQPATRLDHE